VASAIVLSVSGVLTLGMIGYAAFVYLLLPRVVEWMGEHPDDVSRC
jgi:hypothetical protein